MMKTSQYNDQRPKLVDGLNSLDLKGIADYIKSGRAKKVLILTGAGISTAAGIPDFRSPGSGLYGNLHKYMLPRPEAVFSRDYFNKNPEPFFDVIKDLLPGDYKPTIAHYLSVLLQQKGMLLRYYTQNIDSLDKDAGVDDDHLVECHGTFRTATCLGCGAKHTLEEIRSQLLTGKVLRCKCNGIIMPDVVLYGDDLPEPFFDQLDEDFANCDLLIVMGTTLKVEPFPSVVEDVPTNIPRLLINREPVVTYKERLEVFEGKVVDRSKGRLTKKFKFGHFFNTRDVFAGGDIQDSVLQLIEYLGWKSELKELQQK